VSIVNWNPWCYVVDKQATSYQQRPQVQHQEDGTGSEAVSAIDCQEDCQGALKLQCQQECRCYRKQQLGEARSTRCETRSNNIHFGRSFSTTYSSCKRASVLGVTSMNGDSNTYFCSLMKEAAINSKDKGEKGISAKSVKKVAGVSARSDSTHTIVTMADQWQL
jgi:hypothetical protein